MTNQEILEAGSQWLGQLPCLVGKFRSSGKITFMNTKQLADQFHTHFDSIKEVLALFKADRNTAESFRKGKDNLAGYVLRHLSEIEPETLTVPYVQSLVDETRRAVFCWRNGTTDEFIDGLKTITIGEGLLYHVLDPDFLKSIRVWGPGGAVSGVTRV